jgi:ribose-phosphate pyrophosphokinase
MVPAALYGRQIRAAGVDGLVTFDLHTDQIAGFFPHDMKVENLRASPLLIDYLRGHLGEGSVCAPDAGAGKRAKYYAEVLGVDWTLAYKKRNARKEHVVDELRLIGSPENKDLVFIVDDMIATGGSMVKLMDLLGREEGVEKAYAVATHPLLIDPAVDSFDMLYDDPDHPFAGIVTTDSILHDPAITSRPWYHGVDTSRFIAKALYEIHTSGSLTPLHGSGCVDTLGLRAQNGS